MNAATRRFACTQCGKCCNRSPEVELCEAAALADVFVFRLMFRLYWLPNHPRDAPGGGGTSANASAAFYEKKRLLGAFAARKYPATGRGRKAVPYTKYLMMSALALDTRPGACAALNGTACGIYDRRPLSCRSVPFHYSRAEALAEAGLEEFVATPGYRCDTGDTAQVVMAGGAIVDGAYRAARTEAIALAARDDRWSDAIVARMRAGSSETPSLPTLQQIEASAQFAATTVSMRAAWQIAREVGLLAADEYCALAERQLRLIDRELAAGRCSPEARQTLIEMRAEYRKHSPGAAAAALGC
jgi:Fe-S-cluster containining protein